MRTPALIPVSLSGEEARAWALVDPVDYERLAAQRWRLHSRGYAISHKPNAPRGSTVYMHRAVLSLDTGCGVEIDHINRNLLDNRRANLRIATRAQNQQNVRAIGGTSRHRGVAWDRNKKRWRAHAQLNGRHVHVGYFKDEERAGEAIAAWRQIHMPFSEEAA